MWMKLIMASPRKIGSLQQTLISNLASPSLISSRRIETLRKNSQRLNGMNKRRSQRAVELKKNHLSKMILQKMKTSLILSTCQPLNQSQAQSQKHNRTRKLKRRRKMNMKKIRISNWMWILNTKKRRGSNRQMKDKKQKLNKNQSLIL